MANMGRTAWNHHDEFEAKLPLDASRRVDLAIPIDTYLLEASLFVVEWVSRP
jgi:hypothetical protein